MTLRSRGVNNVGSMVLHSEYDAPLTINPDFIGLQTNLVAAPVGFTYGATRTWDNRAGTSVPVNMKSIAPSSGVYAWDGIDALLANNPGKTVHFTLGCPPDWMVSRAAVGGATAYGGKSNMVPDDLDAYCEAVRQIILRAAAVGRAGFVWCLWNEINGTGFFNDSISLLGPYCRRVAQTIRSLDPTATILAPNTNATASLLTTVLATSDGAGGDISDHCDGGSFHSYHESYMTANAVRIIVESVRNFTSVLKAGGISDPKLHFNEAGVAASSLYAAKTHPIRMITAAALGCKSYMGYTYDHATFTISGFASQWNEVANAISGKQIEYAALENGANLVVVASGQRLSLKLEA